MHGWGARTSTRPRHLATDTEKTMGVTWTHPLDGMLTDGEESVWCLITQSQAPYPLGQFALIMMSLPIPLSIPIDYRITTVISLPINTWLHLTKDHCNTPQPVSLGDSRSFDWLTDWYAWCVQCVLVIIPSHGVCSVCLLLYPASLNTSAF